MEDHPGSQEDRPPDFYQDVLNVELAYDPKHHVTIVVVESLAEVLNKLPQFDDWTPLSEIHTNTYSKTVVLTRPDSELLLVIEFLDKFK